ncbi:hypothetical protein P175DRAFT_0516798 [Aspergillus ochraceoroseus IBT 24754]|uniref:Cupin type-1 domain-containing protein n=1 Tax=Aspergillus ochraceoroseus IBT 24754 TaxID=1392256 RepID=A0A2T5LY91_9EURO|nr:uncharacterized protein P175DRAFT_0516798 [Aspergillus ochraceoroseus IBT 24754]PTU21251.1 hypothetical protein P175DRAFT_0516798 [Aspergillus ochraceoroseus IBT 24754]
MMVHWHKAGEWSLVLNGSCRIQAVNENGETFIEDVTEGDVWFFFPSVSHYACLDDGTFSEDNTFLASEILSHNPPAHKVAGGTVKIVDSVTFPIATNFAAVVVTHSSSKWHWLGCGKWATLFEASDTATTFDYRAGDVGYFPMSQTHYIENTGHQDLVFLEGLQADKFTDISVGQWLGSTPKPIVKDTLNLPNSALAKLKSEKQY